MAKAVKQMKAKSFSALMLALFVSGCSSFGFESKKVDYKAGSGRVAALEVPPDMTAPTLDGHYAGGEGGAASYSDFAKNGASGSAPGAGAVLPQTAKVHLERSGTQRWLVAEDRAENVWENVKSFWLEQGFTLKSENAQAGLMETEWLDNRTKIPQDGVRGLFGRVLDSIYSSGEKDQFRVRLERSKNGNTEIYLTHRRMEEVLDADKSSSKWQLRPADPETEAAMLQKMMVRLGGVQPAAEANQAAKPGVVPTVSGADARLQSVGNDGKVIVLNEPVERVWRKVARALESAGLEIADRDAEKGIIYLNQGSDESSWFDRLKFWRKDEAISTAPSGRYRVKVRAISGGSEVSASNADGTADSEAAKIIDKIYRNLGQ